MRGRAARSNVRTSRLHEAEAVARSILAMALSAALMGGAIPARARAPAPAPHRPDAKIDSLITAMGNASTWGHPDLFGEFSGMRLYSEGRYKDALKYFRIGARYADKPSQLAIGLMYANGRGVGKDPVKACAWLTLAAQRKYPTFVATRNRVCDALTPAQHDQAEAELAKLLPVYGDKIAKQRMAFALRQARMQMTGSRTGFNYGIRYMPISSLKGTPPTAANCNGSTMPGTSISGCGGKNFWNADRWDPKQYFAARDAEFRGTVTVGNLQDKHAASSNSATRQIVRKKIPASASSAGH